MAASNTLGSVLRPKVEADTEGKYRFWSVAGETLLLIGCFVFAVYASLGEPRRNQPHPVGPAQQTKTPSEIVPPSSSPVPQTPDADDAVAFL